MRRIPTALRREELITAAIAVISRDGVAAATTRAIVTEAEMPLGSFHYVFSSRDDLIAAVIETLMEQELNRALEQVSDHSPQTVREVIEAGLNGYLEWLFTNPEMELALLELAIFAARSGSSGGMATQYRAYYRASAQMIEQAATISGCEWTEPVDRLARHLTALADGITTTWLADRDDAAARDFASFAAMALASKARSIRTVPIESQE